MKSLRDGKWIPLPRRWPSRCDKDARPVPLAPGLASLRPYLYVLPAVAVLGGFIYWPIVSSLYLSFHSWDFLPPRPDFVCWDNYRILMGEEAFWNAVRVTLIFNLASVPARLALALALALLLLRNDRFNRLARAAFFMPVVVSSVAVSIVWGWMYNTEFGLLNGLLGLVGIGQVPWLKSSAVAIWSIALIDIWKQLGYDMVLYMAGLHAIPGELLEAARIDGAKRWKRLRTIILPLLAPTTFFLVVVSVINSFQMFTLVNVLTEGGPANGTDLLVQMLYRVSFVNFEIGLGSALAMLLFIVLMAITAVKLLTVGRNVHYGYD